MEGEPFAEGEREREPEEDAEGGRVHVAAMSALDVLAEQAAVVISQSPKKVVETQASATEEMQDVVPSSTNLLNSEPMAPSVGMAESTGKDDDEMVSTT